MAKATGSNTVAKTDNNPPTIKDRKMLAQGPACALARFSFVKSTRAKAQNNIKRSGPFLCRDLAHFYSAIDSLFGLGRLGRGGPGRRSVGRLAGCRGLLFCRFALKVVDLRLE